MSAEKNNRSEWLHLRLTPQEYALLQKGFSKTTCRKISEYSRKILLGKPVVATYRNKSLDDFMSEMIQLRKELNSVGNNFNQAVKRLHGLSHVTEFKSWLISYESDRQSLLKMVEEIKDKINKTADQWLQ